MLERNGLKRKKMGARPEGRGKQQRSFQWLHRVLPLVTKSSGVSKLQELGLKGL